MQSIPNIGNNVVYLCSNKTKIIMYTSVFKTNKPKRKRDKSLPHKYTTYKFRAEDKNLVFDLPVDVFELLTFLHCYYCGGIGGGIDRIDSKIGYTIFNSIPCCTQCNMMKHIYTQENFFNKVKQIYEFNDLSSR